MPCGTIVSINTTLKNQAFSQKILKHRTGIGYSVDLGHRSCFLTRRDGLVSLSIKPGQWGVAVHSWLHFPLVTRSSAPQAGGIRPPSPSLTEQGFALISTLFQLMRGIKTYCIYQQLLSSNHIFTLFKSLLWYGCSHGCYIEIQLSLSHIRHRQPVW